ncbi:thymidine phosphorylase, partial [Elusimicrobiota bacterium]
MQITDIIYKKRNSQKLSNEEIKFAVSSYTAGKIPDYQMSALLMAIFIKGMDDEEISSLTESMARSGEVFDLSTVRGIKIDKHSTGGVGDGTSLVIAPLVASVGIVVPMMSGRSLGHTGGTLDKLESIPGFNVNLSEKQYLNQLTKIGVAMIGQTDNIAPADRKIYSLRDSTSTVDSIPLISASIMSKKIAEGCDGLVLDVKLGSGAFMNKMKDAENLSKQMVRIGKSFNKKMLALITDMNQPLGSVVGNSLEIKQCIDVLNGGGPEDFVELCIELAGRMVVMSGKEKKIGNAKKVLKANLQNGKALMKFKEIINAQNGDAGVAENPEKILPKADEEIKVLSKVKGYVKSI